MKKLRYILAGVLTFGTSAILSAMPAMRGLRTIEQPDGTVIEIRVVGDENMHFTTLADGTLIQQDVDGFYRIAKIDADGAVVSAGHDLSLISKGIKLTDALIQDVQSMRIKSTVSRRRAPQTGMGLAESKYPIIGSTKGLIIMVQYTDVKFNTSYDAKSYFNDMINGENFTQYGGTGSALAYFTEQSGGKFTPSFDVYGPVTLPYSQSYYGRNDRYGNDVNAHLMVSHAMDILDGDVDFSQYDTDGDGIIDNVYIFYAGQGEADYGGSNTVWPHSWDVRAGGVNKKYDGVTVARYACSNEWDQRKPDGVGTFVHEFSHVMGLPDLYNTTASAEYTPGSYSVLDYGPYNNDGRTPPNYGAYEKNAMGWYEPIMLDNALSVTLHSIKSGEFGLMPTEKITEFFLFENRQKEGWDAYIPGHGMLIWHIDYNKDIFVSNKVNNTKNHQYVDIVEASNITSYNLAAGYTFPGTRNVTSFTSETTPALKSWSGMAIDYPITDIAENDGVITFDVAGGAAEELEAPEPKVIDHSGKEGYFIASWEPVTGATDYLINVYARDPNNSGTVRVGFDGSQIPEGWEASDSGWSASDGNYGLSSPSFKFAVDGQTLTSEETPGDIYKIEFWVKGEMSIGSTLHIEGLIDGEWTSICEYTPLWNGHEVMTVESGLPEGLRQIRFRMERGNGNIILDDILIAYGGEGELLPDYNNLSTGGLTFCRVDNLPTEVHDYYFTVIATNGTTSSISAPVSIVLDSDSYTTDVKDFATDSDEAQYFNLQGVPVTNPVRGTLLLERRGRSVRKIIY